MIKKGWIAVGRALGMGVIAAPIAMVVWKADHVHVRAHELQLAEEVVSQFCTVVDMDSQSEGHPNRPTDMDQVRALRDQVLTMRTLSRRHLQGS